MRSLAARAAVAAACASALAAAAPAQADGRVALVFLPISPAPGQPLLGEFERRGMAVGLTSPTLGGYVPRQMMLDVSQGSRVSRRTYDGKLPQLSLEPRPPGAARISGWDEAVRRARDAPGDLVPGLLAATVEREGGRVAYAGSFSALGSEAVVAADRAGEVEPARVVADSDVGAEALALWREADLLVVRAPADRPGLQVLDTLLGERTPADMVIAVRAPVRGDLPLLATGVAAERFDGGALHSPTSRRTGLLAAPDISVTILDHLGLEQPEEMIGRVLERRGDSASDVRALGARLDVVSGRRNPAIRLLIAAWLLLAGALWLLRRERGLRPAGRIALLSATWLPGVALLTGALAPGRAAELALLVAGSLALAAATDRLVRWPVAPAVPAAVVLLAHTIDLAAGSALTGLSIVGPNPKGGARFFGIGNELEAALSVTLLIGTGAALAGRGAARAPLAFGLACALLALVMGAGRLGADVGGVITLGAGGAAAVLAAVSGGPSRRALAVAAAVPVLGLAALAAVDLATGGGAHLTTTVLEADDSGDLWDVAERRVRISLSGVDDGTMPVTLAVAALGLVLGWRRRRALLDPLSALPEAGGRAFRAGLVGALAATLVGALANDSGPLMFLVGTAALGLAVAYVQGRPPDGSRRARI